jgi:hypothetical protein
VIERLLNLSADLVREPLRVFPGETPR